MRTHRLENGSRRQFLKQSGLVTIAFAGFRNVFEFTARGSEVAGTGTLEADPAGVLDLPTGFSCEVFSKAGEQMDDGLFVPGKHDGMGAFGGPGGKTILVRAFISGHLHLVERLELMGHSYICSGSVSGHQWNGPRMGTPEGFGVFDCRTDGTFDFHCQSHGWKA